MKSAPANTSVDEYVMGRTSEEYQRLRRQAQLWEPTTRRLFQKIGLKEEMTCLDVGCGPGEVMRLMGEYVGANGRVVGLDVDGKLGREALAVLQATGKSRFEFVEDNIETLASVPGQPFDLTYARLTLLHVRDGIAMLRKMFDLTKPGGWIAVQEYDFRTIDIYPKLPWPNSRRCFLECTRGTAGIPGWGTSFPPSLSKLESESPTEPMLKAGFPLASKRGCSYSSVPQRPSVGAQARHHHRGQLPGFFRADG